MEQASEAVERTFLCWADPRGAALALADERRPVAEELKEARASTPIAAAMQFAAKHLIGKRSVGSVVVVWVLTRRMLKRVGCFVVEVQDGGAEFWPRPGSGGLYDWPLAAPPWVNLYSYAQAAESRSLSPTGEQLRFLVVESLKGLAAWCAVADPDVARTMVVPAGEWLLRELLTRGAERWEAMSRVVPRQAPAEAPPGAASAVDYASLLANLEAGKADAAKAREASEAEVRAVADFVLAQLPSALRNLRGAENVVISYRSSAPASDVARELNARMEIACSGWASGSSNGGCVYIRATSLERVLRRGALGAEIAAKSAAPLGVPYRDGLPPLRLRKVCAQWENGQALSDGSIQVETFSHVGEPSEHVHAGGWPVAPLVSDCDFSRSRYRPHGKTWEEVEALADAAERAGTRKPACAVCNDTHFMELRGDEVLCTHCPTPCSECVGSSNAYCKATPCDCACHARKVT